MQVLPSRTLKLSKELSADLAFNEGTYVRTCVGSDCDSTVSQ